MYKWGCPAGSGLFYWEVKQMIDDSASRAKARLLLYELGYRSLGQFDWVAKKDGKWTVFEVKEKRLYTPDQEFPHYGIGLNKTQLWQRLEYYKDTGLRTYIICFIKGTDDVYGGFLDELEAKGIYCDTPKQNIRVYPLEFFEKLPMLDGSFEL